MIETELVVNKTPSFSYTGWQLWTSQGEIVRLIRYADYLVLAKTDWDNYLYDSLLEKTDYSILRFNTKTANGWCSKTTQLIHGEKK